MNADTPRSDDASHPIYGPDGRPQFFNDPAMDRFVPVVLNLTSELWVLAETVANLKALLHSKNIATEDELDALAHESATDPAREAALCEFVQRTLAPLREGRAGA